MENVCKEEAYKMVNVAGHLREINGYYHIVLSYSGSDGKRKTPSKTTGLPVKGNKKRAEKLLRDAINAKEAELSALSVQRSDTAIIINSNIPFTQFLEEWLAMMKGSVETTTHCSYTYILKRGVIPFFDSKYPNLLLKDVTPKQIQDYYSYLMNDCGLTANSAIHHHANIRKALQYAFVTDMIKSNPADRVQRPKKQPFVGSFYSAEEAISLLRAVKGDPVEFGVMMALYYGLRRSEIVGLKWSAVDFKRKIITINHTVTCASIDGKWQMFAKDRPKNKSSRRSLPLIPAIESYLLHLKERQERNQALCGNCYCQDYLEYVYRNDIGELVKPDYLTLHLQLIIKKHNLRRIRFHDLRHSCASLLLSNGISMKQIQEWLGHSNYSTTANIYAHLDSESKQASADAINSLLTTETQ